MVGLCLTKNYDGLRGEFLFAKPQGKASRYCLIAQRKKPTLPPNFVSFRVSIESLLRLLSHTFLSISIGVLQRVQPINETWLLASGVMAVTATSGARTIA